MEHKKISEGFIIEDEKSFQKEQIESLIERCKKFAMLAKNGNVHIVAQRLKIMDKAKLFLITRFLGAKLAEIEPGLGITKDIANVHSSTLAKFLSVSEDNARTRISDLIQDGFGIKPQKGYIRVLPNKVEDFLGLLEKKGQPKTSSNKKERSGKKKASTKEKTSAPIANKINIEEVIKRLSVNLNLVENKIKDCIYLEESGNFKFNKHFIGKSKHAKQTKCILCTAYVLTVGIGSRTFNSRTAANVCFNSGVDISGLNYAIRELKNNGKISKAGRRSQENIILEAGKHEAKTIFLELCK